MVRARLVVLIACLVGFTGCAETQHPGDDSASSDDDVPRHTSHRHKKKKKAVAQGDDDDDAPKKHKKSSGDDDDDAPAKKKPKKHADDDSDDDAPKKSKKKVVAKKHTGDDDDDDDDAAAAKKKAAAKKAAAAKEAAEEKAAAKKEAQEKAAEERAEKKREAEEKAAEDKAAKKKAAEERAAAKKEAAEEKAAAKKEAEEKAAEDKAAKKKAAEDDTPKISDDDEDEDDSTTKSKAKAKAKSDDDEDKPKAKVVVKAKARSEDDDEAKPKKVAAKSKVKAKSDDDEEDKPKPKAKAKAGDDEEDKPKPKAVAEDKPEPPHKQRSIEEDVAIDDPLASAPPVRTAASEDESDDGEETKATAKATVAAPARAALQDRSLTTPSGQIDLHAGLPIGVLSVTDAMGMSTSSTSTGLALGVAYGVNDKAEIGFDYTLGISPGAVKGPITLHGAYALKAGKLDFAGAAAIALDFADSVNPTTMTTTTTTYASLELGAWVRYHATPTVTLFSGLPALPNATSSVTKLAFPLPVLPYQLQVGLGGGAPIALTLPVGLGYQASAKLYAFASLDLANIRIANTSNAFLFKDFIPLAIGGFYQLDTLSVGATFADDLKQGFGYLRFELVARYLLH